MPRSHVQPCGIRNGRAKLTEDEVQLIRALCDVGAGTQRQIAAEFKVTHATVHLIHAVKRWKHLETR